jgi:hypothetical protein
MNLQEIRAAYDVLPSDGKRTFVAYTKAGMAPDAAIAMLWADAVHAGRRGDIGAQFVKALRERPRDQNVLRASPRELGLGTKATLGADASLAGVDTELPPEPTFPGLIGTATGRPPTLAEVIPAVSVRDWSVSWLRETVNATGAAEVEETATYPEASVDLTRVEERLAKVGVMLPVTDEVLDDDDQAAAHLRRRLPLFVRERFNDQLIAGDGVAPNLVGFHATSGIQTQTYTLAGATASDKLAALAAAAGKVADAGGAIPDAVVVNPAEWYRDFRGATDGNGRFILGVDGASEPFGLRAVMSHAQTEGQYLVGAFSEHSTLFTRGEVETRVSAQHGTYFRGGRRDDPLQAPRTPGSRPPRRVLRGHRRVTNCRGSRRHERTRVPRPRVRTVFILGQPPSPAGVAPRRPVMTPRTARRPARVREGVG